MVRSGAESRLQRSTSRISFVMGLVAGIFNTGDAIHHMADGRTLAAAIWALAAMTGFTIASLSRFLDRLGLERLQR